MGVDIIDKVDIVNNSDIIINIVDIVNDSDVIDTLI